MNGLAATWVCFQNRTRNLVCYQHDLAPRFVEFIVPPAALPPSSSPRSCQCSGEHRIQIANDSGHSSRIWVSIHLTKLGSLVSGSQFSPTGKGYLDLAGRPPFQPFSLEKALPRGVRGPADFLALLALAASSLGVRTGGLRRDMARPFPKNQPVVYYSMVIDVKPSVCPFGGVALAGRP